MVPPVFESTAADLDDHSVIVDRHESTDVLYRSFCMSYRNKNIFNKPVKSSFQGGRQLTDSVLPVTFNVLKRQKRWTSARSLTVSSSITSLPRSGHVEDELPCNSPTGRQELQKRQLQPLPPGDIQLPV